MFGTFTRPVGTLAAFWPANAILLGLFLRAPSWATPLGWAAALVGYLAADMATGSTLEKTLMLTAGIVAGFLIYRRVPQADINLTRPMSVLMIDIDHFKTVNDTYGHPAGDAVLRAVAATLKQKVRASDMIGRVGGEEFCVVVGAPDSLTAHGLAERLCVTARELAVTISETATLSVTISVGVATAEPAPHELDSLIAAADPALYRAKQEGRDRVVLADGPKGAPHPATG